MTTALGVIGRVGAIALDVVGEIVAPTRCAACDGPVRPKTIFCAACASTLERADAAPDGSGCLAVFEYGGAIASAIARLKYEDRADLAPALAAPMREAARRLAGAIDLVVPVPLHPRRLAERGYNQAALLALHVARELRADARPRALTRSRDTPQQVAMDREQRLRNVDGSFAVRERDVVCGKRVLLVDDVRTTGATLDGCARALREVGVRRTLALVLARRA